MTPQSDFQLQAATRSKHSTAAHRFAPHFALVTVQILFGTWPIFGKIALTELPGAALVMIRIVGAALAFLALQKTFARNPITRRRDFARLAFYSVLGISANQMLFAAGLARTTVINTTILATTIPIFATIVSLALRRERSSWLKIGGVIVAAIGALSLVNPLQGDFTQGTIIGDLLIVINCLFYGSYIALSKDVLARYGTFTVIFWIFLFGAATTIPFGTYSLISHASLSAVSARTWLIVAYIIIAPTVGAYSLNAWALSRVSPSVVATYVYLQPLIAFVVAPLILDERISSRTWVAAALIFGGVALVTAATRRSENGAREIHQTFH